MFERIRERMQRRQVEALSDAAMAAGHAQVADEIDRAAKAVPWGVLIAALLPFIIAMLKGDPVDWSAVLDVILNLLKKQEGA